MKSTSTSPTLSMLLSDTTVLIKVCLSKHKPNSPLKRVFLCSICTPICIPCIVWSSVWRVLCCPIYCFNGNPCTAVTDQCIVGCMEGIEGIKNDNKRGKVQPTIPTGMLTPLSQVLATSAAGEKEVCNAFVVLLQSLKNMFDHKDTFDITDYIICDNVVAPLSGLPEVAPADASQEIHTLIKQLESFSR